MSTVEYLELQVRQLSDDDLTRFGAWFAEFEAERWDRQIEADAKAGKFDELAAEALRDHAAGLTTQF